MISPTHKRTLNGFKRRQYKSFLTLQSRDVCESKWCITVSSLFLSSSGEKLPLEKHPIKRVPIWVSAVLRMRFIGFLLLFHFFLLIWWLSLGQFRGKAIDITATTPGSKACFPFSSTLALLCRRGFPSDVVVLDWMGFPVCVCERDRLSCVDRYMTGSI